MKQVPTTWDELRFIDGYPGRYVVLARRAGNRWYIAGVNAMKEPLRLTLPLPMLGVGEADLYLDNQKKIVKVSKKKSLKVVIPTNGGVVITQ